MVEKLSRWKIEYDLKRLSKPVDRTEYDFNAAVVNAYYDSTSNSIKFPAAFLQAPFFHHSFPRALNYGGLGATIGHEITHGFDNGGIGVRFFCITDFTLECMQLVTSH
ncbi:hypothetical protein COOONC_06026 [Cooperia oncophora]